MRNGDGEMRETKMKTYQTTYPETGRTITYAVLSPATKFTLRNIQPEQHVVSEMGAMMIRFALQLGILEDDELTYVRNSVVEMFSDILEYERTAAESNSQMGSESKKHWKEYDDAMTRMSMITAVIDGEKHKRGLAI